MAKLPSVLALIPARAGSKGVPNKNVRLVGQKPLLAWSIEQALASSRVERVLVSTDSAEYAEISMAHGAEVPFLRPEEISGDLATDLQVFQHALAWLDQNEAYHPDVVVHLRPTCPMREPGLIDRAVDALLTNPQLDSVRTVAEVQHPPFKMWHANNDGTLKPVTSLPGRSEPWNDPRQSLPKSYIQTANVDVVRSAVIRERNSMTGDRIFGIVEQDFYDIDTEDELQRADRALRVEADRETSRTFCFDIDGVIATIAPGNDYRLADPIESTIRLINSLYDAGHTIILFTARGSATGLDWEAVTSQQMRDWGVQHHELRLGKPAADFYIDDKLATLSEVEQLVAFLSKDKSDYETVEKTDTQTEQES